LTRKGGSEGTQALNSLIPSLRRKVTRKQKAVSGRGRRKGRVAPSGGPIQTGAPNLLMHRGKKRIEPRGGTQGSTEKAQLRG